MYIYFYLSITFEYFYHPWWKECTKHEDDTSAHVLSDVRDGSVYKSNTLFRESGISIKLILYQDAFEVVNPLGSAKK